MLAHTQDRAGNHDIQAQLIGPGHDIGMVRSRVQPKFGWRPTSHFFQDFEGWLAREIDTDLIELSFGNVEHGGIGAVSLNFGSGRMNRIDLVALSSIGPDGSVAEFSPVGARSDNRDTALDGWLFIHG